MSHRETDWCRMTCWTWMTTFGHFSFPSPPPCPNEALAHLMAVECSLILLSALVLCVVVVTERSPNKTKIKRRVCRHGGINTHQTWKNLFLRYIQGSSWPFNLRPEVCYSIIADQEEHWRGSWEIKEPCRHIKFSQHHWLVTNLLLCVAPLQGVSVSITPQHAGASLIKALKRWKLSFHKEWSM